MTEKSNRLMRVAGLAGAGSAAAGVAIAAALASGVIHDASSTHTTSSSIGTTQGEQDDGGVNSGNSTGGLGVPSQQQGPVARSNGS